MSDTDGGLSSVSRGDQKRVNVNVNDGNKKDKVEKFQI